MKAPDRLIIFTRYPVPGEAKTRLIPALGAKGAARLQRALTEHTVAEARQFLKRSGRTKLEICFSGGSTADMRHWLGDMSFHRQTEGDIGERMKKALSRAFQQGAGGAVLIGSDIPGLNGAYLQQAFGCLAEYEVVLGPSLDGGYYLVGLGCDRAEMLLPVLFDGMTWSTGTVFRTTQQRLQRARARVAELPVLQDIDTPDDLDTMAERGWF